MKKLIIMGLIGLLTLSTWAQETRTKGNKHNLSPEQIAMLQTKKMTLSLDLNKSQQMQILELNKKNALERKAKREGRKAQGEKRETLSTDELVNRKSATLDKQIAHQSAMKNILDEKQYETWKKSRHRKAHALKKRKMRKRMQGQKRMQQMKRRR